MISGTMVVRVLAFVGALAFASGCTSGGAEPLSPLEGSSGPEVAGDYPEGPYGTVAGSVLGNYQLPGWANAQLNGGVGNERSLSMSDFYNPTGDGVYGPDDAFEEGSPRPLGVVINVSAVWCGPCQFEAKNVLPKEYEHFRPLGGELLLVLSDSETPGEPADISDLDNWTSAFAVNYPAVIDPQYELGALFDQSSFPANFMVDTRTMEIVQIVTGIPQDSFWSRFERLLDGQE
jgi:hypothetical protein